ncbi:MAG: hypothetical protein AVDCRST_MAG64-1998, partial [uncultured Phycisphaerae bacterium]
PARHPAGHPPRRHPTRGLPVAGRRPSAGAGEQPRTPGRAVEPDDRPADADRGGGPVRGRLHQQPRLRQDRRGRRHPAPRVAGRNLAAQHRRRDPAPHRRDDLGQRPAGPQRDGQPVRAAEPGVHGQPDRGAQPAAAPRVRPRLQRPADPGRVLPVPEHPGPDQAGGDPGADRRRAGVLAAVRRPREPQAPPPAARAGAGPARPRPPAGGPERGAGGRRAAGRVGGGRPVRADHHGRAGFAGPPAGAEAGAERPGPRPRRGRGGDPRHPPDGRRVLPERRPVGRVGPRPADGAAGGGAADRRGDGQRPRRPERPAAISDVGVHVRHQRPRAGVRRRADPGPLHRLPGPPGRPAAGGADRERGRPQPVPPEPLHPRPAAGHEGTAATASAAGGVHGRRRAGGELAADPVRPQAGAAGRPGGRGRAAAVRPRPPDQHRGARRPDPAGRRPPVGDRGRGRVPDRTGRHRPGDRHRARAVPRRVGPDGRAGHREAAL